MKKRKIKLLASITSLVLVVAVMAVGVWAATTASLSITTTASFTATGLNAKVEVKASKADTAKYTLASDTATAQGITVVSTTGGDALGTSNVKVLDADLDDTTAVASTLALFLTYTDGDGDSFLETADAISVVYTITNEGANSIGLKAEWTNPSAAANAIMITATAGDNAYTTGNELEVTASGVITLTVTYEVTQHDGSALSAVGAPALTISLDNSAPGAST